MKTLVIGKKKLSYLDIGEGFPLLFGHSYLWNASMWQPQIEVLSKHYRCIVPELWAHGHSDTPSQTPYSIEALADDYWQFVSQLGVKKFALIGLSVGGMWGTQLALNHPEAVTAMVVMGSFVGEEPEASRQYYFSLMDAIEQAGCIIPALKQAITPFFFAPSTLQHNPSPVQYFHSILDGYTAERIHGILSIGRGIFSRNSLLENLADIRIPSLFITGADDKPRPPHEAKIMAEKIRGAALDIIPNAGHISNLEQPAYVSKKLWEFLERNCVQEAA